MVKIKPRERQKQQQGIIGLYSKRPGVFVGIVSIVIIAAIAISAITFFQITTNFKYIAKINGEPIDKKEFLRQLNLQRAATTDYFKKKYNADIKGDFWNREFGGEVPVQYAKEKTLEECIRIKIQQALAKEQGLIEDITYTAFLKNLEKENKARKNAIQNHQVIYGPQQYDESGYFSHVFSNLVIRLKERLLDNEYTPSEEQLKEYYEKVKDIYYKKEDTVEFQTISLSYGKEGGAFDDRKRKDAIDRMREMKVRIDKGESFESIAKSNPNEIILETGRMNDDSASSVSKSAPQVFEAVSTLGVNQMSDVLDVVNQRKVEIIKMVKREKGGYKAYEEFKDSLLLNYSSEKYNELLEKRLKEAVVEINEKEYQDTRIR